MLGFMLQPNLRADEAVRLIMPIVLTLESAVEFIDDDELVEITQKLFIFVNVTYWSISVNVR